MPSIYTFLVFLLHLLPAWQYVPSGAPHAVTSGGGGVTFTTVQHHIAACPNGNTCAVSGLTSTTAGNLIIECGGMNSGNGSNAASTPTNEGTWVHSTVAQSGILNSAASQFYYMDCYYTLSATGGSTSISANWTGSNLWIGVDIVEVHRSSGTWTLDTSKGFADTACTSCAGPSGVTLTGTDYVYQFAGSTTGATYSSLSGITTEFIDSQNYNGSSILNTDVAAVVNPQSSYAQPTYSMSSSDRLPVAVLAFK